MEILFVALFPTNMGIRRSKYLNNIQVLEDYSNKLPKSKQTNQYELFLIYLPFVGLKLGQIKP